MVVDTDTYWFGPDNDKTNNIWNQVAPGTTFNQDSGMALSWQFRWVPPNSTISLTVVLRWGQGSVAPVLTLPLPEITNLDFDSSVQFTGIVTDDDSPTVGVLAALNGNYARLQNLTTDVAPGPFTGTVNFDDWDVHPGINTIEFYAVDANGTFSTPVKYDLDFPGTAITPHPSAVRPTTPLVSVTPPLSYTPSVTKSPTATASPYPRVTTNVTRDSVNNPEMAAYFDGKSQNLIYNNKISFALSEDDLSFNWTAHWSGPTAIIGVEVTNTLETEATANISAVMNLWGVYIEGYNSLSYVLHPFADWSGFFASAGPLVLYVFTKNHPMVTDATTFWYGPDIQKSNNHYNQVTDSYYEGSDIGIAISWQNVVVPPLGVAHVSIVFRWGNDQTSTPVLAVSAPALTGNVPLNTAITLTGSVSDEDAASGDSYSVYAAPDGNIARLTLVAGDQPNGTEFTSTMSPRELSLIVGSTGIDFYAVDSLGAISAPVHFAITVTGPPPTVMPSSTVSPVPSDSPNPSVTTPATQSPYPILPMVASAAEYPDNFYLGTVIDGIAIPICADSSGSPSAFHTRIELDVYFDRGT
jgi:hypothetical protein